nr:DUF6421 family protein [Angustibacter aerolatus]
MDRQHPAGSTGRRCRASSRPCAPTSSGSTATASTGRGSRTGSRRTRLVATYVQPNPGSTWAKGVEALPLDGPVKPLNDAVMADEFPLNTFYEALRRKLADVVTATAGITGSGR